MKPITRQLIIGAFIMVLVTVASLGIRTVRFRIHRANTIESPVIADTEPDPNPANLNSVDVEPEPQYADASDWDVDDEPDLQHATSSDSDKETPSDNYSDVKSFKGKSAKSKGSKGLEKISLGDHDNLYITEEGEQWYVSEQPDGSISKTQVQIDDTTGEIAVISNEDYAKSDNGEKGAAKD